MRWASVVITICGACLASFATRSSFVETLIGLGVPGIFPPSGPVTPAPPSLSRVPGGEFPDFLGTVRRSDSRSSVPPRFVAFAWRYPRCARASLPRTRAPVTREPGPLCSGGPSRFEAGDDRVSQVPGDPISVRMPCSQTPAGPRRLAQAALRWGRRAIQGRRLPQRYRFRGSITRPSHSLCTLRSGGRPPTTQHSVPVGG